MNGKCFFLYMLFKGTGKAVACNGKQKITKDGKLLKAIVQGKEIEDDKDYTVATIDYLADGNDGLTPLANADKRECPDGMTLRGLFLDYVRQQTAAGKKITSKLDGRITVVPASDQK